MLIIFLSCSRIKFFIILRTIKIYFMKDKKDWVEPSIIIEDLSSTSAQPVGGLTDGPTLTS